MYIKEKVLENALTPKSCCQAGRAKSGAPIIFDVDAVEKLNFKQ